MTEELLNALQLIKDVCIENENCTDCPMMNYNGKCGVYGDYPSDWNLEKREVYF